MRSKNELAKRITHKKFSQKQALDLINKVISDPDKYWKDSKMSEPTKGKYVRNARGTPLGTLLKMINTMVLAPHDRLLPIFIFGGIKKANHVKAAAHLLGEKRKRTILKMDITKFFEQITQERVKDFFQYKCHCDEKTAKMLSEICCVPLGPKGAGTGGSSIGRGYATSSRLAVWCNLDAFTRLERLVQKRLRGRDPRVAIYVDDIGITASKVSKDEMESLAVDIEKLLSSDPKQPLPLNTKKTKIISHEEGMEHLGIKLYRNRLAISSKTGGKIQKLKNKLQKPLSPQEREALRRRRNALGFYKRYVEAKPSSKPTP